MNARQLAKLGVPEDCITEAIQLVQAIAKHNRTSGKEYRFDVKEVVRAVVANAEEYAKRFSPEKADTHDIFYPIGFDIRKLAEAILEDKAFVRPEPIEYKVWGDEIDEASHAQMKQACSLPMAVGAALMPDAHSGYGLPIGGVLGLENAVCPYAVGVDIACRMKMSIFDIPAEELGKMRNLAIEALEGGTVFGVGKGQQKPQDHAVMDEDWGITKVTRDMKETARVQLGTSGSGNHFVEFGTVSCEGGDFIALLSHSGSRGPGAAVCKTYSGIAQGRLPNKYKDLGRLAWLDLDSEEGQEYWEAMLLMGRFSAANHDVIHRNVSKIFGQRAARTVENHHNFAWKEMWKGKEIVVHRKGATPAGLGVAGVIPGSMGTPAYVVQGLGNEDSLCSASHGAGRLMSRKKAKEKFAWKATKNNLEKQGITVLAAAADEVPGCYKDIESVMAQQKDLVRAVGKFLPKIVMMCGDGSKAED
jgi:tRNA-splicing ligase RtcB